MSVSGLQLAGNNALMLHQPHQARFFDAPGDRFTLKIPFDTPNFNKNNLIQIPSLEMVVDEVYVELHLDDLDTTGGATTASDCCYIPTAAMVSDNGCQLFYQGQSVYTASSAELLAYPYVNCENDAQLRRRLDSGNQYYQVTKADLIGLTGSDTAPVMDRGQNNASLKNRRAQATTGSFIYYLDLRPFLKILKHCGPLSAYAPNKWSISIGLLPAAQVGQDVLNIGGSDTTVSGAAFTSSQMYLCLTGHREDAENTARISQALAADGVKLTFTQSNHFTDSLAASATSKTFSFASLEGEATDIWVMNRVTANLTASGTNAAQTINPLKWDMLTASDQTVAIGTSSNPTRVFGQYLAWNTIRLLAMGTAYYGGPIDCIEGGIGYVSANPVVEMYKFPDQHDLSILFVPLAEAASDGQLYGTYSGSIRLKNDFQVIFSMGTAPQADTMNFIIYIRRNMVITHLGIVMMNEG